VDEERQIIDLTTALVGRVLEQYHSRIAEFGLSAPEAKALLSLQPGDTVPMRTIAERIHANPSNLTLVISKLQGRGLIRVTPAGDRRVKGVTLTDSGATLRQRLEARLYSDHPAVQGLSANQRTSLLRILRRLTDPPNE
jgi:DNA-binding MarR family transcriptional regulator